MEIKRNRRRKDEMVLGMRRRNDYVCTEKSRWLVILVSRVLGNSTRVIYHEYAECEV